MFSFLSPKNFASSPPVSPRIPAASSLLGTLMNVSDARSMTVTLSARGPVYVVQSQWLFSSYLRMSAGPIALPGCEVPLISSVSGVTGSGALSNAYVTVNGAFSVSTSSNQIERIG